ncbi:MAG: rRNA maturation RNase YbeY [Hyphomicrobiales bacterium]|nr:rRNA maturation RNase YbeY [Hyphomicrobiales bacterium]MDE2017287.1 rRNA maturation RNase YbeY [Hyphomicrobiales bacterium]
MTLAVAIVREDGAWRAPRGLATRLRTAIRAAAALSRRPLPRRGRVNLLLCGDEASRALNARWRGLDKPTNVLSFPAAPGGAEVGDIALAEGVCAREAVEQGKPALDHATHLAVHGFLHLVGYDHVTEDGAREMEGLETRILAGLGIGDPYGEPAR